jgi:hypothetical protein
MDQGVRIPLKRFAAREEPHFLPARAQSATLWRIRNAQLRTAMTGRMSVASNPATDAMRNAATNGAIPDDVARSFRRAWGITKVARGSITRRSYSRCMRTP